MKHNNGLSSRINPFSFQLIPVIENFTASLISICRACLKRYVASHVQEIREWLQSLKLMLMALGQSD